MSVIDHMSPSSCFILERNGSSFAQQKKGGAMGGRSASLQIESHESDYAVAKAADPKEEQS